MSENDAILYEAKSWAVSASMGLTSAIADTAHALASTSHLVVRGHLQNARNALRDAEENLTRALINIESIETDDR